MQHYPTLPAAFFRCIPHIILGSLRFFVLFFLFLFLTFLALLTYDVCDKDDDVAGNGMMMTSLWSGTHTAEPRLMLKLQLHATDSRLPASSAPSATSASSWLIISVVV